MNQKIRLNLENDEVIYTDLIKFGSGEFKNLNIKSIDMCLVRYENCDVYENDKFYLDISNFKELDSFRDSNLGKIMTKCKFNYLEVVIFKLEDIITFNYKTKFKFNSTDKYFATNEDFYKGVLDDYDESDDDESFMTYEDISSRDSCNFIRYLLGKGAIKFN